MKEGNLNLGSNSNNLLTCLLYVRGSTPLLLWWGTLAANPIKLQGGWGAITGGALERQNCSGCSCRSYFWPNHPDPGQGVFSLIDNKRFMLCGTSYVLYKAEKVRGSDGT